MREIQASEAKTHLPRLLDDVERGETILITRHGRPIARLVPETDHRRDEVAAAVAGLRAMRARLAREGRGFTAEDFRAFRDEGRR